MAGMEKSYENQIFKLRSRMEKEAGHYSASILFTPNDAGEMVDLIRKEMAVSQNVWIASAFYSPGVINLFINSFARFIENGGDLKVLTSTMGNVNQPEYLLHLRDTLPGMQVRAWHPPEIPFEKTPPPFHPKAWLFQHSSGRGALLIGSSNFTQAGFLKNVEWNYFSANEVNVSLGDKSPFEAALCEFERCWEKESVEISDEFISAYEERWQSWDTGKKDLFESPVENWGTPRAAAVSFIPPQSGGKPGEDRIAPNPAQREALRSLSRMRDQGIGKAAVIAATGVGKTHLAAFDYRQSGNKSLLFIAHRENILQKARKTFGDVMADGRFGAIVGAGQNSADVDGTVFAMIQTLSRPENLDRFPPEYFEYLVVDEFHHGMALTYRKVIDYFKPRFMLCLTATPERMDGRDVLRLCDYNVAYEVRLLDAVDRGWLCPFQYFAVYDRTDYDQITWRGTHYDDEELTKALNSDTRTSIVAANLKKYLPSRGKIKALAFCSSVDHAHYTAKRLSQDHHIEAVALSGVDSGAERTQALTRLEDENDSLRVVCSVNIFNEGVDIPGLSHVLLLRPTQSFTVFLQQLGRGLRKAPGKEYLVVIDFVGNFKKAHVAPLALSGYTSIQEVAADGLTAFRTGSPVINLPQGCYLDPDLEAKRIWDQEIRAILRGKIPLEERLKALYSEIRADLDGESPLLTDFLDNAHHVDPYVFIRHFGNWLRTKLVCEGQLNEMEKRLLDTPGEAFLKHLESELSPVKSYKMVVLTCLLEMGGSSWRVEDIAKGFLDLCLAHRDMLFDYEELAASPDPDHFPLSKVKTKLLQMPLNYLSNTDKDWFILDRDQGTFELKPELVSYWKDSFFRGLVSDRVKFGLVRYFSRKGRVMEVFYDDGLLESGFPVGRDFALDFFTEKPLKPGEERNVKLKAGSVKYDVLFRRSQDLKTYRIVYISESPLARVLNEMLGKAPAPGAMAFKLRVSGKNELVLELPSEKPDLRGILVEIPYSAKTESGFTARFRKILREALDSGEWSLKFDNSGYTGTMDIEIAGPGSFSAWTSRRYDDPSRFPARIKAAATALFAENFRGIFKIAALEKEVRITRDV